MKKLFALALAAASLFTLEAEAQGHADKSKRKSPQVSVSQQLENGTTVKITYGQPSLKGRSVGKDVEPMNGQLWRTGANEATTIEFDKPVKIDGTTVPAGKYSLFTIYEDKTATVILNKKHDQWGTDSYNKEDDQVRTRSKVKLQDTPAEKLTFTISPKGEVELSWGHKTIEFTIQ